MAVPSSAIPTHLSVAPIGRADSRSLSRSSPVGGALDELHAQDLPVVGDPKRTNDPGIEHFIGQHNGLAAFHRDAEEQAVAWLKIPRPLELQQCAGGG